MKVWVSKIREKYGPGVFTYGAKYIAYHPYDTADYHTICQAPEGKEDTEEWFDLALVISGQLNGVQP